MAKCFDVVGYIEPCNAVRQKYTGRALLMVAKGGIPIEFTVNGLIIDKINLKTSFNELISGVQVNEKISFLPVYIYAENPFGVTVQGNTDSGRVMYTKTIPISLPAILYTSEMFIMGLQKGTEEAQVLLFLERTEDGAEVSINNDAFGAYSPVRIDPNSVTRSEYENGGAWTFNLVCEEPVPNVICALTGLSEALDAMNA